MVNLINKLSIYDDTVLVLPTHLFTMPEVREKAFTPSLV